MSKQINQQIRSNSLQQPIVIHNGIDIPIGGTKHLDQSNGSIMKQRNKVINITTQGWNEYQKNNQAFVNIQNNNNLKYKNDQINIFSDVFNDQYEPKNTHQYKCNIATYLKNKFTEINPISAYERTEQFTQDFVNDQTQSSLNLTNMQIQTQKRVNNYINEKKQENKEFQENWKQYLKHIYMDITKVVQHIIEKGGESQHIRLNEIIQKKQQVTEDFLQKLPKQNSEQIENYVSNLRILLSKKTDEMGLLKQIYGNSTIFEDELIKELTLNIKKGIDVIQVLNSKYQQQQNPLIDEKVNELDSFKVSKYLNWSIQKQQQNNQIDKKIKDTIRRVMANDILSEACHIEAQNRRKEKMRSGSWNEPIKYPKRTIIKSKNQELVKQAMMERAKQKVQSNQEKNKVLQKKQHEKIDFFNNYNSNYSVGECFESATKYKKQFE